MLFTHSSIYFQTFAPWKSLTEEELGTSPHHHCQSLPRFSFFFRRGCSFLITQLNFCTDLSIMRDSLFKWYSLCLVFFSSLFFSVNLTDVSRSLQIQVHHIHLHSTPLQEALHVVLWDCNKALFPLPLNQCSSIVIHLGQELVWLKIYWYLSAFHSFQLKNTAL